MHARLIDLHVVVYASNYIYILVISCAAMVIKKKRWEITM